MAVKTTRFEALILAKARRVVVTGGPGDGAAAARQFDAVAMCAGFKCSRELLERLSQVEPGRVIDIAAAAGFPPPVVHAADLEPSGSGT